MKKAQPENITPLSQQLSGMIRSENEIVTDILGSYTGTPKFGEKPEQDADDL